MTMKNRVLKLKNDLAFLYCFDRAFVWFNPLMKHTRNVLSRIWTHFQTTHFPWLEEELGELTDKQKLLC